MSEEQKQSNRRKWKVRARVEHIFGAQQAMGGHLVRTIGLARAKVKQDWAGARDAFRIGDGYSRALDVA